MRLTLVRPTVVGRANMVLISLKSVLPGAQSANDGFLYKTTTSTPVDELIDSLVEIHNARLRCCLIADAVKGLAMYGVMKRPEDVGTDHVSLRKKEIFNSLFARHF